MQCAINNFINYLTQYDINEGGSYGRLKIEMVPDDDAVYEGHKIFEFFFTGTRFSNYKEYKPPPDFEGIKPGNIGHWLYVFDRCVQALTDKF